MSACCHWMCPPCWTKFRWEVVLHTRALVAVSLGMCPPCWGSALYGQGTAGSPARRAPVQLPAWPVLVNYAMQCL